MNTYFGVYIGVPLLGDMTSSGLKDLELRGVGVQGFLFFCLHLFFV